MASCTLGDEPHVISPGPADWRSALSEGVRSAGELCRMLGLDASVAAEAERASGGFPLLAPRPFVARIQHGDPTDPLLLQILPRTAETIAASGFGTDPLGETDALCGPGLLRKYQGRILILSSGSCAVHCRYCFRRHFPYNGGGVAGGSGERGEGREERGEGKAGAAQSPNLKVSKSPSRHGPHPSPLPEGEGTLQGIAGLFPEGEGTLQGIAADRSIHEVILSGGDPLMLDDETLARLSEQLGQIAHLRRLRIHTRLPVMIPQRVTNELISWLRESRLTPVVVVQVNHPAEIDADVAGAFGRLVDAGVPLLNQSVLLRDVNDRADVLAELCERLVNLRVMPYYLHQLDTVAGAAHFEVPVETGLALMAELRARLPGYAVPRYARESRGGTSKEVLA
jgi:L-lysine 2,3-aminomutase